MPEVSIQSRARISDDALFQELQGEAVLLDLKTGVYFGLDKVGTRIWELLSRHELLSDILAKMLDEYDVTQEQCARDLFDLIQKLESQGLVTIE